VVAVAERTDLRVNRAATLGDDRAAPTQTGEEVAAPRIGLETRTTSLTVVVPARLPQDEELAIASLGRWIELLAGRGMALVLVTNGSQPTKDLRQAFGRADTLVEFEHVNCGHRSGSKAENLDFALRKVHSQVVAFFDVDAAPDPQALDTAVRLVDSREGRPAVQGPKMISLDGRSASAGAALARSLAWSEYCMGFVLSGGLRPHEMRSTYFAGSNGFFKREILRRYRFGGPSIAEDLDLSARMAKDGIEVTYCAELMANEQPPARMGAYWFQHRRWVSGWARTIKTHGRSLLSDRRTNRIWAPILLWPIAVFALVGSFATAVAMASGWTIAALASYVGVSVVAAAILAIGRRRMRAAPSAHLPSVRYLVGSAAVFPLGLGLLAAAFCSLAIIPLRRFRVTPKALW
jgi:cellulose synthase/poly-beta-1,6-N-acetylglucosamine synthase-like glycosyltransferase